MTHITPEGLSAWLGDPRRARPVLLDVREPWEFQTCRIGDALHIPMREIPRRLGELNVEADTVVICHHGVRSLQVAHFLEQQRFARVYNLTGGVNAWARSVDPAMPVY
jgi:rhodanese-related sulfurtransferase